MVGNQPMTNPNPLQKYFRQPAIYLSLPSKGEFYPNGALDLPPNGELPVLPMTAMDEITYRTADGLFNGSAVVSVIKSCVPNIIDPWQMPTSDLDSVLVAIRIASYGHEMEFESKCPQCGGENNFGLDLREVMGKITMPDYTKTVDIGDIQIFFRPLNYENQTKNSLQQFEDQKILQTIPSAEMPESDKLDLINAAIYKLGEMTVNALSQSISMIKAGDDVVTDKNYISDFIRNCNRQTYDLIKNQVQEFRTHTELQPVTAQCGECSKQYTTPFTLDMSHFFGSDS